MLKNVIILILNVPRQVLYTTNIGSVFIYGPNSEQFTRIINIMI